MSYKHKDILIILDGLMEKSFETFDLLKLVLGEQAPKFKLEMVDYYVQGKPLDSLNCMMNMFGYPSDVYDIGERAYYEGLSQGIYLGDDEVILRCNVIKGENGILTDFTGGELPKNMGEILSEIKVPNGAIIPCDTYKNLLMIKQNDELLDEKFYPPHFYMGQKISELLPVNIELQELIQYSADVFKQQGVPNRMLWPWGLSSKVELPNYQSKTNKVAGLVSGIDLVHGMGLALGMKSLKPLDCNGYEGTNLTSKLNGALHLLDEVDSLVIHINGLDELAHKKDRIGKLAFLKQIQTELILPLIEQVEQCNIRITCDHRTDSLTGAHEVGDVPLITLVI